MGSRAFLEGLAAPLALVAAVFALYAQTAGHEFVEYDTAAYLSANPRVLAGLTAEGVGWAFTHFQAANWHPLTWISHMLDVSLFGLAPAGHQLENAAWHALAALLALALFGRLGLSRPFAFAAALAFAIHPLRAESVAWIVERKDLLAAVFGLAALVVWLDHARRGGAARLAAVFALYACSLMSKPMLVSLPCLLALFEFWPLGAGTRPRGPRLAALGGLALLAFGSAVLTVRAQSAFGALQPLETLGWAERDANALASYGWYLGKSFWPAGLCFHYPIEPGGALLGVLALLGGSAAAWALRRRSPGVLVGWLWFVGALVPVIGVVQAGAQAHADRYTYFPSLGLLLALGLVAEEQLLPRLGGRVLATAGLAAALALGLASFRQIATWKNTETLARRALEVTRGNSVALDVLGASRLEAGRVEEALPLLREAYRLSPGDPEVLANLGVALQRSGEYALAEELLRGACERAPSRAQNWSALGGLLYETRRLPEALAALERALSLDSEHLGAWANRGLVLEAQGRTDEARSSFEIALALPGNSQGARLSLARLLLRAGRGEEARPHFEAVLRAEPANFDALRGLERVELARGELERAFEHAEAALRARPGSALALGDEAWILALAENGALARPQRALELAEQALAAGGEQPALLDALAFAAAACGDYPRAAAAAEKALAPVRQADPAWAARLEARLAAYRAGSIDRRTPR